MDQPTREFAAGSPDGNPESGSTPVSTASQFAFESVGAAYDYFHALTARRMRRLLDELGAPPALSPA
jgi:hypothetical protein